MNSGLVLLVDCWCSFFTAGILRPVFASLIPSPIEDRAVIDFGHEGGRQDGQDQATPKGGEGVNENRFAVEKIEEPVIENLLQA